ncbi:polyphosphate kinase 2 family protein [Gaopeijia maritima]|uniref:Polyphosphate kinase 2 family protein n=1 Tax=Gaopeijia maritima TaxID=3119007 RepID=A0ABU9EH62_9BACT
MQPVPSPYLVPFDGSFRIDGAPTAPPADAPGKSVLKDHLGALNDELADLQRQLYAEDRHSLLLVFQAMDAAGKDGTIRKILRGVNPAGCQVFSFKQPSKEELDHDFLWRVAKRTPERGRIGVFNRSHYEEVLVVRVHPEYLGGQRLPVDDAGSEAFWNRRLESIGDWERHLADSGTVILKFFLNVSREEQRDRFLDRLNEPEKHWKFSFGDVEERQHWGAYMDAYQKALAATSRPWAPWYAIPADDKHFMRTTVAGIVVDTLRGMPLAWPTVDEEHRARFAEMREMLERGTL